MSPNNMTDILSYKEDSCKLLAENTDIFIATYYGTDRMPCLRCKHERDCLVSRCKRGYFT